MKTRSFKEVLATDTRWLTISNALTFARVILSPFIVICLYYQQWFLTIVTFIIAALTDVLDGHIARLRHEQTQLGTLLDPIADKILLLSSFAGLTFFTSTSISVPWWFLIILFFRELCIIIGALFLLFCYRNIQVKPLVWGKATTFIQASFLMWIFTCHLMNWHPYKTYMILLIIVGVFSVLSLAKYAGKAISEIRFFS